MTTLRVRYILVTEWYSWPYITINYICRMIHIMEDLVDFRRLVSTVQMSCFN